MSLRVNVSGKNISFDMSLDSLVSKLKDIISERIGLPLEQIILLFNGQVMLKDMTLDSYGCRAESLITL